MTVTPLDLTDKTVVEKTTRKLTATVTDDDGVTPIASSALDSLTVTLHLEDAPATIINGVDGRDILNVNEGTVDVNGLLTYTMRPDDNPIVGTDRTEIHLAVFKWTFAAGLKSGGKVLRLQIINVGVTT